MIAGTSGLGRCGGLALLACRALGGVAFLATTVLAQTAPFPVLPPEPPAVPPPALGDPADASAGPPESAPGEDPFANLPPEDTADVRGRSRPKPWEYSLGAGVGWNSNINFDSQAELAADSVALSPIGSLSRIFWGRRADLRADVVASFVTYPEQETRRHYVNLGLEGRYRSSPLTTWSLDGTYELGNSNTSQLLTDQGLFLPQVETRTLMGQLSLERQIGTRSAFRLTARYYDLEFVDALLYMPGRSVRGTLGVDRRLSQGDTASLQYSVEDVLADEAGRSYLTHFASLQWSHLLTPQSGLLLEGGASYTPEAELAGLASETSFYGGVSYSRRVKRSDIRLYLRREVVPAFGFGVSRAGTRGELSAAVPIGKDWRFSLVANRVHPTAPPEATFGSAVTDQVLLSLGRQLRLKFEVSANVRYRRRGPTDLTGATQEFVAGVFFTFLTPSAKLAGRSF